MILNIENYPEITFFETVPRKERPNPDSITFQYKRRYKGQTFYNQCEFSNTFIRTMPEVAQKELDNFYLKSIETFEKEKVKL